MRSSSTYDLYGSRLPLANAKDYLENALKLRFEARESLYQGGAYFRATGEAAEHFDLKQNVDPFDGDPVESNFPSYPTLLYINSKSGRALELEATLDAKPREFFLLKREVF
jgi:hypothetical protein